MAKNKTIKKNRVKNPPSKINKSFLLRNIVSYFTTRGGLISLSFLLLTVALLLFTQYLNLQKKPLVQISDEKKEYWFILNRKSNVEKLFMGIPGDQNKSKLIKTFTVKVGIPGQRPTPLPQLMGKEYWVIDDKFDAKDYPETAPYFLKLDVPVTEEYPYGPVPYNECNGGQCNWELPGYFGLHGINNDPSRLSTENLGSSGCVRHTDEDITYLYNLLEPEEKNIRYYIKDI